MGNYYLVIKTIKGNRYYYWQKTYREGRHIRTLNKYIGPVGKVPRPIGAGPVAYIPTAQPVAQKLPNPPQFKMENGIIKTVYPFPTFTCESCGKDVIEDPKHPGICPECYNDDGTPQQWYPDEQAEGVEYLKTKLIDNTVERQAEVTPSTITDFRRDEIETSILEGINIIKRGKNTLGEKLTQDELLCIQRSIQNARRKLGEKPLCSGCFRNPVKEVNQLCRDCVPTLNKARAQISKLGGYSRISGIPLAQQNAYAADELASSFNLNAEYWYKYATEANIPLLPYLRRIDAEESTEKRFAIINEALEEVARYPTPKPFTYAPIQPSTGLNLSDAAIEKKAIAKLQANRAGMLKQYTRSFGKVVNADLARRLFKDCGYNGRNSAAVHEPSSALAKDAWRHNLKENSQPDAILYAGMSGAGKSSAVTGVLPHIEDDAAAVLDGNLSKISTAEERIKEALDAGKDPIIVYVWRDPVDAWINGVVKRMKSNAEEGGRVVPMSEALKNGPGSLATVRAALSKGAKFNEDVYIVDNSLGSKNAKLMDREKFDTLSYPDNLRDTLLAKTKELYDAGQITAEQYQALIA